MKKYSFIIELIILLCIIFVLKVKVITLIAITIYIFAFVGRSIIYLLKFKSDMLKRILPKYKWHIQRLHEIYIGKDKLINESIWIKRNL
jgi:hypothetical protein